MTLANDSATLGTGDVIATHTQGAKEHQVVMIADDSGHLVTTKPAYTLWIPGQVAAASKLFADLFNATGSGKLIEIYGVWAIPKSDTAVAPTVAVPVGLFRTSTVGATANATAGYNTGSVLTAPVITPVDTNNAALPAQITARMGPTTGATIAAPWWENYVFAEETNAAAYLSALINLLPSIPNSQPWTLREGQGMLIKEGSTSTPIGTLAFLVHFKVF